MPGHKKKDWTKAAHERHWLRLLETMKNPITPSSYYKKKQLLDDIKDDFIRY